jgi:holo-[acyl-carrier protein] synthase
MPDEPNDQNAQIDQSEPTAQPDTPQHPIAGLGVDIVELDRMRTVLERTPRFKERVFTAAEREYCERKAKPWVHYALFFAAREAVLKALGTGFAGIGWSDVEVLHDEAGKPLVTLHGAAAELAESQGIVELALSLSHTHSVGVASAVAIKSEHRPRPKFEKVDPKAELTKQFKELRSLLDEQ